MHYVTRMLVLQHKPPIFTVTAYATITTTADSSGRVEEEKEDIDVKNLPDNIGAYCGISVISWTIHIESLYNNPKYAGKKLGMLTLKAGILRALEEGASPRVRLNDYSGVEDLSRNLYYRLGFKARSPLDDGRGRWVDWDAAQRASPHGPIDPERAIDAFDLLKNIDHIGAT